jgi:beta-glucosidase
MLYKNNSEFWLFVFVAAIFALRASAAAQAPLFSPESAYRAEVLLKQMTLDEKVGQLNQASGAKVSAQDSEERDDLIAHGKVGSVLWLSDVREINRLQHVAVERSRLRIPILFGLDVINGYRTMFPVPLAMASSWDPSLEEAVQKYASADARAAGMQWTFAPLVDIARDARWGRIVEGAGEDPYLGSAMARAQVRGFQGARLGPGSVLACLKTFAGYGAPEGGRDYDSSYIPEELLRNVYLPPFHAGQQAGAGSFMSAYMDLNDVPASGNRWLLTGILRKEWGFQGFVVSDAFAVAGLQTHGFAADPADAAFKAFRAGLNMDMASQTYTRNLANVVKAGKVSEADVDKAVLPILALKYELGLFDHPYVDAAKVDSVLNTPEGLELARRFASRCMVLLKNESHTLPLAKTLKKIAVIGPLADSTRELELWSAEMEGMPGSESKSHPVTVLAALKNRLPDAEINFVPGPEPTVEFPSPLDDAERRKPQPPPSPAEIARAIERARAAATEADVVIAVMGERADMISETRSRATLDLPGIQEQILEGVAQTGKPVVLVLENGRPLDVRWAASHVQAILESWYGGTEHGNAVVDLLFGDVNPGGKLPVSWPRVAGAEPLYYNHNLTHEPEDRPDFTSRYWDVSSKPLYPFGYGLSYTTFKFANLRLSQNAIKRDGSAEVSVDVSNTGPVAGDAVAQLYIHQRYGSASRPVRELKGFRRVTLGPGETQTVKFRLGKDELEFWSPQTKIWAVEPSTFDVWAGEDSSATLHTELVVRE